MSDENPNPHRRGGTWMLALSWLLIGGGLYWYFSDWSARQNNPNTASVLAGQRGSCLNLEGYGTTPGTEVWLFSCSAGDLLTTSSIFRSTNAVAAAANWSLASAG